MNLLLWQMLFNKLCEENKKLKRENEKLKSLIDNTNNDPNINSNNNSNENKDTDEQYNQLLKDIQDLKNNN